MPPKTTSKDSQMPEQANACPKIKGDCAAANTGQGRIWCDLAEKYTDEFDECPEEYPEHPGRTWRENMQPIQGAAACSAHEHYPSPFTKGGEQA